MEKRTLEILMFVLMTVFVIGLPWSYYNKHLLIEGAAAACGFISIIIWIELDRIHSRERELNKKYGRRKRR